MSNRELSLGQEPAIMQETQALRQDLFQIQVPGSIRHQTWPKSRTY